MLGVFLSCQIKKDLEEKRPIGKLYSCSGLSRGPTRKSGEYLF